MFQSLILIFTFLISPLLFAETKDADLSLLIKISYQSQYGQDSSNQDYQALSMPLALGVNFKNLYSFGIDYTQTRFNQGNKTFFLISDLEIINLFFDYNLNPDFSDFSVIIGFKAGMASLKNNLNIYDSSTHLESGWHSYNALLFDLMIPINQSLSLKVGSLFQNSSLINPQWQPAPRLSVEFMY